MLGQRGITLVVAAALFWIDALAVVLVVEEADEEELAILLGEAVEVAEVAEEALAILLE